MPENGNKFIWLAFLYKNIECKQNHRVEGTLDINVHSAQDLFIYSISVASHLSHWLLVE